MNSHFYHIVYLIITNIFISCVSSDNLLDICPTDTTIKSLFINGLPCKNPSTITASDFKASLLNKKGETKNLYLSSMTMITAEELPGLNTLGISAARTDLEIDGLIMPHTHPRASEIMYVSSGSVIVGFIDTKNTLFQTVVEKGDVFIFPRGLLHYCLNYGFQTATVFSVMNSQNPGIVSMSGAIYVANDEEMVGKFVQRLKSLSRLETEMLPNFTFFQDYDYDFDH